MSLAFLPGGCGRGARKFFLKQCLKQGFLVHSEQIVKGGCGHWISSLLNCLKIQTSEHNLNFLTDEVGCCVGRDM